MTTTEGAMTPVTGLLSLLAIVALLGVAIVAWRRGNRMLAVGIPLFFVLLGPVAQIVPHPERMAERFLYLPSLAFFLMVAGALPRRFPEVPAAAGRGRPSPPPGGRRRWRGRWNP